MSLELISKIEQKLDDESISVILEGLKRAGYKSVYYFQEFSSYGFVQITDDYIEGLPPLFDLIPTDSFVCIAVYGDLNDLEIVKNLVSSVFLDIGVRLNFLEEGEE